MPGLPLPDNFLPELTRLGASLARDPSARSGRRDGAQSRVWRAPTKWVFLLASLILVTGCVAVPPRPLPPATTLTQRATLPFNLNGRFAVQHRDKHYSGGLRWQHEVQRDELLLQGPLGITAARIVSDARQATLEQNGKRYTDGDVEALMQQVLGWGLPLPVLQHWIMGAADGSTPADIERDELGRIALLRQAGWEVRYARYAGDSAGSLPSRITLVRDDLHAQLLLDEWEFNPQ